MPDQILDRVTELSALQPGLFGIKPTITHEADSIPNTEVQKIAQDVLNAARLSLTAVVAAPEAAIREGSAESALAVFAKQRPEAVRKAAQARAKAVFASDKLAKEVVFGRFATRPEEVARENGFLRIVEDERPIAIDLARFGVAVPEVTVPISALTRNATSGRIELAATTPGLADFEAALKAKGKDFEWGIDERRKEFEEGLNSGSSEVVIDHARFASQWGQLTKNDPYATGAPSEDFEAQAVTDKLRLWIRSVRCNDETDPEFWGDDEIALAGVSIDEDGDTKPIGERYVGGGFHDGVVRSPNWDYHMFGLRERNFWPKKFGITLILAEKDNGGLSSFMQRLWNEVRDAVHKAITAAATSAGVALATFLGLPEVGPLVGRALAAAANWIIDTLVGWLINLFQDDIFKPFTAWINIPSMSARWNFPNGTWGNVWSPLLNVTYTGFGGQYRLTYQWQLYS